eukprot:Protomagalhaensia_wolfi_Nauph_80__5916@NODE_776_length_2011_cov_50_033976_g584_i0_p1_GENE_NODE_776_length_2011_cov_50_033976_g584_i0NODE_776_length_2011_cov_50_033976_g584_i0_p1_ORF_typecomplete_len210_score29_90_NODE_776_length_2011_cov_50_033976_g584_i013071936
MEWQGARVFTAATPLTGQYGSLEPLNSKRHGTQLATTLNISQIQIAQLAAQDEAPIYALVDMSIGQAVGIVGFSEMRPEQASMTIHWHVLPTLEPRLLVETIYLLAKEAFDHAYVRLQWVIPLGEVSGSEGEEIREPFCFQLEGVLRSSLLVKGQLKDAAIYSMIAHNWPQNATAFETWLKPDHNHCDNKQMLDLVHFLSDQVHAQTRS